MEKSEEKMGVEKMIWSIYLITNTVNMKVYVGQTNGKIRHRFWTHCNSDGCPKIHRAIKKYGVEQFRIRTLLRVDSQEAADAFEIRYIDYFNSIENGYNLKTGGSRGCHNEETKEKIRLAHLGSKRTPEQCATMAASKMGEKNPMFGKPHSEEHKARLSASMKGMHNSGAFHAGHDLQVGSKHAQSKLDEEKVATIKALLKAHNLSEPAIAKLFGVSRSAIAAISQGRCWKHVPWE